MGKDIYKEQLISQIEWTKSELETKARNLSDDMFRLAERIKKGKCNVNSLGEVQWQGIQIDTFCSKLSTLQKQLEIYDSVTTPPAKAGGLLAMLL